MLSFLAAMLGLACAPSGGDGGSTPAASSKTAESSGKPQAAQKPGPGQSPAPIAGGAGSAKQWSSPPAMAIDPNKQYLANITTNMGTLKAELFAKEAPNTVNNFVFLAREGFYNDVPFHRVIAKFMVQTGDPTGTGRGGPGYRFPDELPTNRKYERGTLAMANAGPNTNGSQFFIIHQDYPLPPRYSIFGKVVEGLDTLDKIATAPVRPSPSGEQSVPTVDLHIESISIEEK